MDTPSTQIHDRSPSSLAHRYMIAHCPGLVDTPSTQIHDRSPSWLDTPSTQIHDRSPSSEEQGQTIQ
jgi:hypothetical protein